ncbi:hypothetical protein FQZ97_1119110 [compost metagenome]
MGPKRNILGQAGLPADRLGPQVPDILAMHPRQQADPAVGLGLVVEAKFALGHIDEYLLKQVGKPDIGNPLFQHQPHQWAHYVLQRRQ